MVTVVVSALASTSATVKINFYNAPEKFLKDGQVAIRMVVRPDGKNTLSIPVELTDGEWAVAISQDLNNNNKLDKNFLGIPTEPFAFSNNVKPRLSAPSFQAGRTAAAHASSPPPMPKLSLASRTSASSRVSFPRSRPATPSSAPWSWLRP